MKVFQAFWIECCLFEGFMISIEPNLVSRCKENILNSLVHFFIDKTDELAVFKLTSILAFLSLNGCDDLR